MRKSLTFSKMHGAGNDYVYVDARYGAIEDVESLAIKISDRHFGVGSDGLVLIMNSEVADFRMRMFNADGSEAGMCGNASRCVGKYVYDKGLTDKKVVTLETKSGIKILYLEVEGDFVSRVTVDMGTPGLKAADIPVLHEDTMAVPVVAKDREFIFTTVSMGNPHAVTFVDDVDNFDVEGYGKIVENHPLFPERCNVEFAQIVSDDTIKMRVWERGSGETLACGTGACATLVASNLNGKSGKKATIKLIGGDVEIEWNEENDHVSLTGGAEFVFEGEYFLD